MRLRQSAVILLACVFCLTDTARLAVWNVPGDPGRVAGARIEGQQEQPPVYTIAGRVTDENGSRVADVLLTASRISDLPTVIEPSDEPLIPERLYLPAVLNSNTPGDLSLPVFEPTGNGSSPANIHFVVTAITDGNGNYVLSNLPAGNYVILPSHPTHRLQPDSVKMAVTQNQEIDFVAIVDPSTPIPQPTGTSTATEMPLETPTLTVTLTVPSTATHTPTVPPTATPTATPTPTATHTPTTAPTATATFNAAEEILISAGSFLRGSLSTQGNTDERPQRSITLSAYYIDKYEVTNARYKTCVDAGTCTAPGNVNFGSRIPYYGNATYANYPVVNVNWTQARAFCTWAGRRLPTGAEWEKAARGTDGRVYPWGGQAPDCNRANFLNGSTYCFDTTRQVGAYPTGASPYSVMDMAGNVGEWVNDWYSSTYYNTAPTSNPPGPASGTSRVVRGGGWDNSASTVRSAYRQPDTPVSWNQLTGFRCARSP